MIKRFWAYLVSGMASTLGAIIITKVSKAIDQDGIKDKLKAKINKLKNRIHKEKDEP